MAKNPPEPREKPLTIHEKWAQDSKEGMNVYIDPNADDSPVPFEDLRKKK